MVDATRPRRERKDTMYYEAVSQCTEMLKNIGTWLDNAEKHAAAKKFDVNILITERLAPDMKPFIYQVQALATTSKRPRLGFQDKYRPSTKTTSRRSLMHAPGSRKLSLSQRA
jgi:hypothetical protein